MSTYALIDVHGLWKIGGIFCEVLIMTLFHFPWLCYVFSSTAEGNLRSLIHRTCVFRSPRCTLDASFGGLLLFFFFSFFLILYFFFLLILIHPIIYFPFSWKFVLECFFWELSIYPKVKWDLCLMLLLSSNSSCFCMCIW